MRLEGGSTGPDLTGVAGRFNNRNLLESIIEPSKVVSDQYEKMQFQMTDGRVIEGRVINLNGDSLMVLTNMYDPDSIVPVKRGEVEVEPGLEDLDDARWTARYADEGRDPRPDGLSEVGRESAELAVRSDGRRKVIAL